MRRGVRSNTTSYTFVFLTACNRESQLDVLTVYHNMTLATELAPVSRVRPNLFPRGLATLAPSMLTRL